MKQKIVFLDRATIEKNIVVRKPSFDHELIEFDYFRKNVTGNLTAGNTYLTAPTDFKLSFSFIWVIIKFISIQQLHHQLSEFILVQKQMY